MRRICTKVLISVFASAQYLFFITLVQYVLLYSQLYAVDKPAQAKRPRNVILVIGDGMGPQQVGLGLAFAQRAKQRKLTAAFAHYTENSAVGIHLPFPSGSLVNDSACSATMLSSGSSCTPGQLGIDEHGNKVESVVSTAKKFGKRVGLISDTRITHATPAAFAVHVNHRSLESEIAEQIISQNRIDLLFSGGLSFFVPAAKTEEDMKKFVSSVAVSPRQNGQQLLLTAKERGYTTVFNQAGLRSLAQLPALGLFAASDMQNAFIEGTQDQPTLAAMTEKALKLLDNPEGFFLMVESGQIDWAGHQNDPGWLLRELIRLSSVLQVIEDFSKDRQDTLVILTADHETGGFGFSYDSKGGYTSDTTLDLLNQQSRPIQEILPEFAALEASERTLETLIELVHRYTGVQLEHQQGARVLACFENPESLSDCDRESPLSDKAISASIMLGRAVSAHFGVVWATGGHTSTPVLIFSQGPAAQVFAKQLNTPQFGVLLKQLVAH
jgi:alkaline phosphatase